MSSLLRTQYPEILEIAEHNTNKKNITIEKSAPSFYATWPRTYLKPVYADGIFDACLLEICL